MDFDVSCLLDYMLGKYTCLIWDFKLILSLYKRVLQKLVNDAVRQGKKL